MKKSKDGNDVAGLREDFYCELDSREKTKQQKVKLWRLEELHVCHICPKIINNSL